MTLPLSTTPSPQNEPEHIQGQPPVASSKTSSRPDRARGFLTANGVERSTLWMALGLAVITFLVLSFLGKEVSQPDQSDAASTVIEAPIIPLPEGDIGGASQETAPQE